MIHKDSDRLKSLLEAFKSAEETVKTVVLNTKAKTVEEYKLKVEKKLDRVNIGLVKQSISWANGDIPKAYQDGKNNVDSSKSSSVKIDRTDVENAYIQLAHDVQHATDTEKENIRIAIERAEKENIHGATVASVKDIIQEELSKNNSSMVIKYSNGAKMPLSAHAEMLARTSRIIASNTGSFDRCKELGVDLVRCTTVAGCCPYCKKYEGKVYSISGRDTRFPALYETALQSGYNIMHPNCRHEFIPFVEQMENPENLKKIIEDSNHFEDYNKDDKLFKIYNRNQALQRQWVDESREFHRLQAKFGEDMPYKTLGGFKRARRQGSLQYKQLHYHDRDEKLYEDWKKVVGEKNMPKSLETFQEIRYNDDKQYRQLQEYKGSVGSGKLSPLVDFNLYKKGRSDLETVVGQQTANGVEITGIKPHFYERFFGSVEDKRNGVSFEDVKKCLDSGEAQPIRTDVKGRKSQVLRVDGVAEISINPDTGELIQVNPYRSKRRVKK